MTSIENPVVAKTQVSAFIVFPPRGLDIEQDALDQLRAVAGHGNTQAVAGFPDMHPGKCGPVGMAALCTLPVPALLGNDVGCGFSLFRLDLKARRLTDSAWIAGRLDGLDVPDFQVAGEAASSLSMPSSHDLSLGTIGLGNHFLEVQVAHQAQADAGVCRGDALLLVHSGSRGMGEAVYREVVATCRDNPLAEWEGWLRKHDLCVEWARVNRICVARRVAEALGVDHGLLLDLPHNLVERTAGGFLHRKGASPSDRGLSILPGSRATPSFLVSPTAADQVAAALSSLPHGAGRRLARGVARTSTKNPQDMRTTPSMFGKPGGIVICGDDKLMLEERAEAYKDVNAVLQGVEDANLGRCVAEMHPVVTFKRSEELPVRDRTRTPEARKASMDARTTRRKTR